MAELSSGTPPSVSPPEDRLDSWKEIAAYLDRSERTVRRWESSEGLPVHRREHEKYLPDYNATDRAITIARRANPAADHAAQATVIYPLQRPGAPDLAAEKTTKTVSRAE